MPAPYASQTATVALHHEKQQPSIERQVNKQLLGPVGCLSSAITGEKKTKMFETDVTQFEPGRDWNGKKTSMIGGWIGRGVWHLFLSVIRAAVKDHKNRLQRKSAHKSSG